MKLRIDAIWGMNLAFIARFRVIQRSVLSNGYRKNAMSDKELYTYIPSNLKPCRACGHKKARHFAKRYTEPKGYYVWCDTNIGGCGHEISLCPSMKAARESWDEEWLQEECDG